jgi:transposase-like protein
MFRLNSEGVAESREQYWRKRIAEQEASGQAARPFCRERGICDHTFYAWRKRLREESEAAVSFALLESKPATATQPDYALELVLGTGERLRIGKGVDAATLRLVVETLKG